VRLPDDRPNLLRNIVLLCLLGSLFAPTVAAPQDIDYPRLISDGGNTLKVHAPVIDRWDNWERVEGWIPVEVQLQGSGRWWIGAVRAQAATEVDIDRRLVTLSGQQVLQVRFTDPDAPESAGELARKAVRDRTQVVTLDELLRVLAPEFKAPQQARNLANLNFEPPRIVVSERPLSLLLIDGQPVRAPISGTALEFVVNADRPLFHFSPSGRWYVLNHGTWQTSTLLSSGGWATTDELPADFRTLAISDDWPVLHEAIPPRLPDTEPEPFLISLEPTELIVTRGQPVLRSVGAAELKHVVNTDRDLFELNGRWYFLAAGRWFDTADLQGRWRHTDALPEVFAAIPFDHARAHVRAAVPGTEEAIVSVMEATLPRHRTVASGAGQDLQVGYVGAPRFEPIEGTGLQRAINSPQHVVRHSDGYYLCVDAAWFFSRNPDGPWTVASDIPDEVYRIPATDPAYPVTYVVPDPAPLSPGNQIHFTWNRGYLGEYSTGVTVVHGTGWYYSPWVWHSPGGYPVYWSYPRTYGWYARRPGDYNQRFYYWGGYWGRQSITIESPSRSIHGDLDPAFADVRVARRGLDYATLAAPAETEARNRYSAADDLYTDADGDVYRRDAQGWSKHTDGEWSTMAALERQYGTAGAKVGQAGAVEPRQSQAYRQNERDIERLERYYQSRQRSYNLYGTVYVRP